MMNEKKLFLEIPGGKNVFHSALLTTYSFDFHHFEYQVLKLLRQKWITNIAVLVDQNILDDLLGLLSGDLKHISQSYSVNGIKSKGAFHPKINFLIGDNRILVFFGSGNITPGGHGKNHELFAGFYADTKDSNQLPLILECWDYIKYLSRNLAGYSEERLAKIPKNTQLLNDALRKKHIYHRLDDTTEAALLYNEASTILHQLVSLIPADEITKIIVVSPYYDEDGETLNNLTQYFKKATLDAYIPEKFGLPPVKIKSNKRMHFYSWNKTTRGQKKLKGSATYDRKLHSKIYLFKARKFEYCLIGSANATKAGLGTNDKALNEEFCVLYKVTNSDLLKELGIIGNKEIKPHLLLRSPFISEADVPRNRAHHKIYINSSDLLGQKLKVFIIGPVTIMGNSIIICNNKGEVIHQELILSDQENPVVVILKPEVRFKNPCYLYINNQNDQLISNYQVINIVDKLYNTDPSKSNRTINQLINALSVREADEFDLLEYFNELFSNKEKEESQSGPSYGSNVLHDNNDDEISELTYDEAVVASKKEIHHDRIFKTYHAIRLWEMIFQLFHDEKERKTEELMDEEETASAESGMDRTQDEYDNTSREIENRIEGEIILSRLNKLKDNYINSLNKLIFERNPKISSIDLTYYLLVTHIFSSVCIFSKNKLNNTSIVSEWSDKLKDTYLYCMLQILEKFTHYLINSKPLKNKEEDISDEKYSLYLKTSIFQSLLNIFLLYNQAKENFLREELELIALNIFEYLGIPDAEFDQYINNFSHTNIDVYFSAMAAVRLKNRLLNIYDKHIDGIKYFRDPKRGICFIIEKTRTHSKYKSVTGIFI